MLAGLISACSTVEEAKLLKQYSGSWTLEFTVLKNDKPTKVTSYEYDSRSDCFNAMYQMQQEAKKIRNQSGAGLCYKAFADGQERTSKDVLALYK